MKTFAHQAVEDWSTLLLHQHGLPEEHARQVAQALVDTDLRGIGTHGVAQLPFYVNLLERGVTNAVPSIRIEEREAMLAIDADRALGQVAAEAALAATMELAGRTGLAAAAIHNAGHFGALGCFTRRVAEKGMLALMVQNGPPLMALPHFSRRAIGNNPISFAAPVPDGPPLVFDMAASEAAYGKVMAAARAGEALPEGWALDEKGEPTSDARKAVDGMLLPAGGPKGIGLAMMVECLAGSLTGTRPVWGGGLFGAFLLVIDQAAATSREAFASDIRHWLDHYTGSGKQSRYPGERTAATRDERLKSGIPLAEGLVAKLDEIGRKVDLPFVPPLLAGNGETQ